MAAQAAPADDSATGPAARYSVARLTLSDFRCYEHLRLETGAAPVVLTGPNGAGKTNLLEALSFLVPGRGLRGARLGAAARRAPDEPEGESARAWAVAATVHGPQGPVDLGTGRETDATDTGRDRRVVHVDGEPVRTQSTLAEHVAAVWLTPAMDRLFAEGASARRKFLDRLVFGFDAAHAGRVSAYETALRERARLLRERGPQGADPAWLDALEETLAARGVAVAAARLQVTARLAGFCAATPGPFPAAEIGLAGDVETWLDEGPALAAEDRLRAELKASRVRDSETGGAAVGPHRSDLVVRDAASGLAAGDGSTGQQKALLVAIVLASARMQAAERGPVPLLLLDEVAAHLDEGRRAALFDELLALGAQAWMTGTDAGMFRPLTGRAQFFRVEAARLAPTEM